jgi:D-amino-acid oxidase
MLTRRRFLQALALTSAASLARASRARLLPVDVSLERITRRLVGLRPFRPAGFVVKTQSLGEQTVIHNYGHGGAGITLSWGTSQQAVELGWQGEERDFAVLGCGVVGLATARLLQQRGGRVTIYARDLPPQTTSNIAGGQWGPASVSDPARRTPEWIKQFDRACSVSFRAFQDLVGESYGVNWLDNYMLSLKEPATKVIPEARDQRDFAPACSPFPGYYARRWTTMMVEPALYLRRLEQDLILFGGKIEVRNFPDLQSIGELSQRIVFNCTGLGSRELFGDQELIPVRGQLSVLLPQPEIDYAYLSEGGYMFPRRDGIILGGTFERNVCSLEPDLQREAEILQVHRAISAALARPGG